MFVFHLLFFVTLITNVYSRVDNLRKVSSNRSLRSNEEKSQQDSLSSTKEQVRYEPSIYLI